MLYFKSRPAGPGTAPTANESMRKPFSKLVTNSKILKKKKKKRNMDKREGESVRLRILPSFVMDEILGRTFLVGRIREFRVQDLGFIK